MSCPYYINNGYTCSRCDRFIKITELNYNPNTSELVLCAPKLVLKNHERFCLCITKNLPDNMAVGTHVFIKIGSTNYPVITCRGNYLYADAIKERRIYPLEIATDTKVFVLRDMCKIGKTSYEFPIISNSRTPRSAKEE